VQVTPTVTVTCTFPFLLWINKFLTNKKNQRIMTASNNSKMQLAVQMVIMDAIEKGHTNSNELIDYMQSDVFATAAKSYFEMLNQI